MEIRMDQDLRMYMEKIGHGSIVLDPTTLDT